MPKIGKKDLQKIGYLNIAVVTVAIIATILIFIVVKGSDNRFTLIMPIFAGIILYFILTLKEEK